MSGAADTLKQLRLFSGLTDDLIAELVARLQKRSLAEKEILFNKGDPGDALYLIEAGIIKIVLADQHGRELLLSQRGPGDVIGEISLVKGQPRTASAVADEPVEILQLKRDDLMAVLNGQPVSVLEDVRHLSDQLRLDYMVSTLKRLPLFAGLSKEAIADLVEKLEERSLVEGELLFHKGDPGEALYIISTGWVKIVTVNARGEEVILNQCGPREAIGEMSLVDQEPRSASVVALSPVEMFVLKRDDFLEVLDQQPTLALDVMRNFSARLRYNTTYIEKIIELSERVAEGDYSFAMDEILTTQSSILDASQSDEARAGALLAAFFRAVKGVKEREEKLQQQLQQLTVEIDEAKRRQDFEQLTQSAFFADLKAASQKLRQQRSDEDD